MMFITFLLFCALSTDLPAYQNLALNKPTACSSHEADYTSDRAVDGDHDKESRWGANPYPQWLEVDLEDVCEIDAFHVYTYWDGWRYYQYFVEVSLDGNDWTQVVDMSENTTPSTSAGFAHPVSPMQARFVRIEILLNSANPGVHVVELEAYGVVMPPGHIEVSPSGSIHFGSRDVNAGPTATQSILIQNVHNQNPLVIESIALEGPESDDFAIVSDSGESTLAPLQVRTLEIAFDPFMEGPRIGRLVIRSNDPIVPLIEKEISGQGTGRLLPLIPYPEFVVAQTDDLIIRPDATIRVSDADLLPVANVVADEIHLLTGFRLDSLVGVPSNGDLFLTLDPGLYEEEYTLSTQGPYVVVSGKDLFGLASGTASLIQLLGVSTPSFKDPSQGHPSGETDGSEKKAKGAGGNLVPAGTSEKAFELPVVEIHDQPQHSYRAVSIDVARKHHTVDQIKQLIDVCRFYKIRYMGLHITDDQNFMFPSTAFPDLDNYNNAELAYTIEELEALEAYARARGVLLVPELDVPGHSGKMVQAYPQVFGSLSGNTIDFRLVSCREGVKTIINEMCDIFQSTPFFHVGGDESGFSHLPEFVDFLEELNLCVKNRGKKTLMWEGFSQGTDIPKDIWILNWESSYFRPDLMLQDGYTVINAGWDPLYVCDHYPWIQYTYHTMEHLYDFDLLTFGHVADGYPASNGITVESSSLVPGAEMCLWEGKGYNAVPFLRNRIPPFSARLWNPAEERCFESFMARVESTEALLEGLLFPVTVSADGLLNNYWKQAQQFAGAIEVCLSSDRKGTIRYTLNNSEPNATSQPYTAPLSFASSTTLKAALFQEDERLGFTTRIFFEKVVQRNNITLGKPVTTNAEIFIEHPPSLVTDGVVDRDTYWSAYRNPKWIQVDLGAPMELDSVTVFSRWGNGYYERYTVELSLDLDTWISVADHSQNTTPATASGYLHEFPVETARYIRVNTIGNSWFPSGHFPRIVEIHASEAKQKCTSPRMIKGSTHKRSDR